MLFAEMFLYALWLATVVIIVAIVFPHAGSILVGLVLAVGGYAGVVIGCGVLAVVLARRHIGGEAPRWARRLGRGGKRWELIQRWFAQVRSTVDSVRHIDMRWATAS